MQGEVRRPHPADAVHRRPGRGPPGGRGRHHRRVHPVLRARAESRLGLFTTAEARTAGYGSGEIRDLCRTGRWVRLRRGVLVSASDLAAAEQRDDRHRLDCLAVLVVLDRPSTVLSHVSAARLWQLPVPHATEPTIRLTDPDQWREGRGWRMTCAPLRPADRWRSGPLRLTSASRTLVDCAREWPLDDAVVAMDAAVLAGRTTVPDLRAAAAAVHHWRGASRAVRAAGLTDGRAESPLESRGRLRIVGSGLPAPQLQVEIRSDGRLVGVVDAWFGAAAVAVEFDGRVKYTDPWRDGQALWAEKRREDDLRALGIRVVRIADADLGRRWPAVEARLTALLATAGPSTRPFTATPRARGVRRPA